jgi:2-dehydro-3-deoxyphosphogluconate aldolase/(4S)-4-hydroxy-2-oxoglutarate aldolase
MTISSWLPFIYRHRAIAVIRCDSVLLGQQMAEAVALGGMRLIEITWNSDRPAELIQQLRVDLPDCWIGAGTLMSQEQVKTAIAAGAQFLFTPHVDSDLIRLAIDQDIPIVPGALSPTEIVQAWQAGASSVKVFPVQALGGIEYIRSLQGPLGQIPLIPTGGVTVDNAKGLLHAGAIGVGLSSSLFPKSTIIQGDWNFITQQAKTLVQNLNAVGF